MELGRIAVLALFAGGCLQEEGRQGWEGEPEPADRGEALGEPVTARIGPEGGELASADGVFLLVVPEGALSEDTELELQPITNTAWGGLGDGWRLSPALSFDEPVEIVVRYDDDDLLGTTAEALGVAAQDGEGWWHAFADGEFDTDAQTLTVWTEDLGAPTALGRGDEGSVDFAKHWRFRLDPHEASVKRAGLLKLELVACTFTENFGWDLEKRDVLGPPAPFHPGGKVAWSVRGEPKGSVTGDKPKTTYTAPSSRQAQGRTNWVKAKFSVGDGVFAPEATVHIEEEDVEWVGTTTLETAQFRIVSEVTWDLEDVVGTQEWYVPRGRATVTFLTDTGGCVYAPLSYDIVERDGALRIETATDPPTYSGMGSVSWNMSLSCNGHALPDFTFATAWFGDDGDPTSPLGEVEVGAQESRFHSSREVTLGTMSWDFTSQ